jgi:prephenate dehydrogenase
MAQVNLTIVGLGKVGGSMGLALRALSKQPNPQHHFTVTGYAGTPALLDQAVKLGAIDKAERSLPAAVSKADLVFLDLPYHEVESALGLMGEALKAGAVVMDASLLKQPAIRWSKEAMRRTAQGEPESYLVGVHLLVNPVLLGDYRDTLESARADLFSDGLMIISPAPDCPEEAVQLVADVAALLGIKQHFADPSEHDGIIAAMEGLPLLAQLALFRSLSRSKSWDDLRWMGNTAFFLNTYQLAQNDAEALGKVLYHSREALGRRVDDLMETLGELREVLRTGDELAISEAFDSAMAAYAKWDKARRTNEWLPMPQVPSPSEGFRPLGNLLNFGRKKKS